LVQHRRIDPVVLAVVVAKIGIHLASTLRDNWFRDEFYYLAYARRLDWSYVDHPAFSIAALAALGSLATSLITLRLLTAALGGLCILVAADLARQVQGSTTAMRLTAVALLLSPGFLGLYSFYSMNAWEPLFWLAGAICLILLSDLPADRRWWLLLSLVLAIGLHNKWSMLWFGVPALAVTAVQWGRWPGAFNGWCASIAVIALAALPLVWWQATHGYPTLEFMANAQRLKLVHRGVAAFWLDQLLVFGPLVCLLGLAGSWGCLTKAGMRRRSLPVATAILAVAALLTVTPGARSYYMAPAYAVIVPLGAAVLCSSPLWQRNPVAVGSLLALLALPGVAGAPLALPLLTPEQTATYATALGIQAPREEQTGASALPQHLADRHGWEELARTVAGALESLPPATRASVTIMASNYGQAGALEFYRSRYGLPDRIVSPHNNYWYWAHPEEWSTHFVTVGFPIVGLSQFCDRVVPLAVVQCQWCRPGEDGAVVAYCEYSRREAKTVWQQLRRFL